MKTRHTHTHILSAALLTALALSGGCMKSVPYEVRDGEASQKVESPAPKDAVETPSAYVVEGIHDDPRSQNAVKEISILKPQTMVVSLASLKPGKEYSVNFFCYDAKGKEAHRTQKPYMFTPSGSKWWTWVSFTPDYKTNAAGKWTWVADVSDFGKLKAQVGVLPPTPDEAADLARYEKARENLLRAFSHYWLGLNGTFHTVIGYEPRTTQEEKELLARGSALEGEEFEIASRIKMIPAEGTSWRRPGVNYNKIEYELTEKLQRVRADLANYHRLKAARAVTDPYIGYLEVAGLGWAMTKGLLSEADKLNGITFRGGMTVNFRVFRYYRPEGWTDWEDCARLPWMFGMLFGNMLPQVPSGLEHKLNLSFSVMERDGNWFVSSSLGEEFANGKRVGEESDWKNVAPLASYAEDLIRGAKSFTRESYRLMGQSAREHPAAVEQSAITTMALLRGRELAR